MAIASCVSRVPSNLKSVEIHTMSYNVPDDWDQYYSSCSNCGRSTHASEDYRCGYCEAREEREERENRNPTYTLFTERMCEFGSDVSITETGYTNPKYFSFSTLEEAKTALAHHMFEGELSEDGLSKTFRDADGTWITYSIAKAGTRI
jgi:hypothetical protein